jgi:hypothetical protein
VIGVVANATNATAANSLSGVLPIANSGTGSSTQNFVDLSTNQTIAHGKSNISFDYRIVARRKGYENVFQREALNQKNLSRRTSFWPIRSPSSQ